MMKRKIGLILSGFLSVMMFSGLSAQNATDLLSLPSITYDSQSYTLNNACQLNESHFKQVYFSQNENSHNFTSMIQLEVVFGEDSISRLAKYKLAELEAQKKAGLISEYFYEMNSQTGDYFLYYLSTVQKNKKSNIVEWNAFHYKPAISNNTPVGLLLFSFTKRSYKKEASTFLQEFRNNKTIWTTTLKRYAIPEIKRMPE